MAQSRFDVLLPMSRPDGPFQNCFKLIMVHDWHLIPKSTHVIFSKNALYGGIKTDWRVVPRSCTKEVKFTHESTRLTNAIFLRRKAIHASPSGLQKAQLP